MPHSSPVLTMYQRIAVGVSAVVAAVFVVILYSVMVSATVTIGLKRQSVPLSITTPLSLEEQKGALSSWVPSPSASASSPVRALYQMVDRQGEWVVPSESRQRVERKAQGTVTIVNRYSRTQPLVKTTRLLSPSSILFRLDESVIVPAGGRIEARVTADIPGDSGDIGPTRFTIPGLWEGLRELIYAQSQKPMSGGLRTVSTVDAKQVEKSTQELVDRMRKELVEEYTGLPEAAEQMRSITLTASRSVTVTDRDDGAKVIHARVRFLQAQMRAADLSAYLQRQIVERLSRDVIFAGFNRERPLEYRVDTIPPRPKTLDVHMEGEAYVYALPERLGIVKEQFAGMRKADVEALIKNNPAVVSVQIRTRPFWLRRLPTNASRLSFQFQRQ